MKLASKKILICGYGNIGQHLYKELEPLVAKNLATIDIYDKYKNSNAKFRMMILCKTVKNSP